MATTGAPSCVRISGNRVLLPGFRPPGRPQAGNKLDQERRLALPAVPARLPFARARGGGRGKARVPAPAATPLRDEQCVPRAEHLAEQSARVGIVPLGARRHREIEIGPRLAGHVLALAVLPALRLPVAAVAVVEQRGEVGVGAHVDRAAGAAVAAVRPAFGDELFAAKGARPGAACAGDHMHYGSVYEHCGLRIADCGLARPKPRPIRAVRIDATVIASNSPVSSLRGAMRGADASEHSQSQSNQKAVSSASSSTIPIFAMKSLLERARQAAR